MVNRKIKFDRGSLITIRKQQRKIKALNALSKYFTDAFVLIFIHFIVLLVYYTKISRKGVVQLPGKNRSASWVCFTLSLLL